MKKFMLVFLVCAQVFLLCACNQGVDVPGDSSAEVSDNSQESNAPPVETVPVTIEPITFTEDHKESMEEYLRGCKYVSFMQEMENGIEGQAVYSTTRYSLSVNVEQKVQSISMRYITVEGVNREGVGYKIYSDGEQTIVSEDGVWVEAGEGYDTLAWDLSQFSNALDVFNYLMHDVELPIDKEGTSTGEYWTIEFTEPADDSLLAGLEYDSLVDAKYTFKFRYVDDTVRPDSVTIRVGYIVADVQYYVESTIQMNSFGNTPISMPKIGTNS